MDNLIRKLVYYLAIFGTLYHVYLVIHPYTPFAGLHLSILDLTQVQRATHVFLVALLGYLMSYVRLKNREFAGGLILALLTAMILSGIRQAGHSGCPEGVRRRHMGHHHASSPDSAGSEIFQYRLRRSVFSALYLSGRQLRETHLPGHHAGAVGSAHGFQRNAADSGRHFPNERPDHADFCHFFLSVQYIRKPDTRCFRQSRF